MPKWTEEQSQAIQLRNANILVSAAAGSGKTAVLVERIYTLLAEEGVQIENLLIVTFTNAAASEMRERIAKRLKESLQIQDNLHIRKQMSHVGRASISTIHSFCIELLRRHFHVLGIDPNFKIGDETELNIIREEAVEAMLDQLYENLTPELEDLVETYTSNKSDKELGLLVQRIYGFMNSKVEPWEWLADSIACYNQSVEEYKASPIYEAYMEETFEELKNIYEMGVEGQNYVVENGIEEYIEAATADLNLIEDLLDCENDMERLAEVLSAIKYTRLKTIKKDRKEAFEDLAADYKDKRADLKKALDDIKKKIKDFNIEFEVAQMNEMYPRLRALEDLIKAYHEAYTDRKQDREILDFNDLEHFTLKLLAFDEVAELERARFQYIFLDEYQDTNEVQEYIISRIKRDNNLFQVGDVKQSIYRFRLADPSIFIHKKKSYQKEAQKGQVIQLHKNFRSRASILEGINFLFKSIMSESMGEIDYDETEYLNPGTAFESIPEDAIEVDIIHGTAEDDIQDELLEDLSKIEKEAYFVANRIKSLLGKETYDAKEGVYRPIRYGDIVILLRAVRNWAITFNEILIKEGIPVYVDDSESYLASLEVSVFVNLLKIIDNQNQDLPLISVLRSPIVGLSTEELVDIRIEEKDLSYYEATLQYAENHQDELGAKLKAFYRQINTWKEEALYIKLSDLFWKILNETNFYSMLLAMPGGKQRQANIQLLIDRAYEFETSMQGSLFEFLRYIDLISKQHGDLSSAKIIGESENVVRIMSIHKSKGLEFPVVILSGTGKQFNMMDLRSSLLLHKSYGLATRFVDVKSRGYRELLIQSAFKRYIKKENLSEEMRILYVAMTRAVDRLIMTGFVGDKEKELKKWQEAPTPYRISKDTKYLDWIMRSLNNGGQSRLKNLYKINYIPENQLVENQEAIENALDFKAQFVEPAIQLDVPIEINNQLNYKYPYQQMVTQALKIGVTQLNQKNYKKDLTLNATELLEDLPASQSINRGLMLHTLLQKYNPDQYGFGYENIVKFAQNLDINRDGSLGIITKDDAEKIEHLYQSEVGERLLKAKKVYREQPFVLKMDIGEILTEEVEFKEAVFVQGIIDCFFEEAGEIVLIDYKTGKVGFKSEDHIRHIYGKQIDLYQKAIEATTQKKVKEKYLYMVDSNRWVNME